MFFERYETLCKSKGKSTTGVGVELEISRTTISYWRNNANVIPKQDVLTRIAEYFNVSTDYLLGNTEIQAPNKTTITDTDIKFALFGGNENITDEMLDEVKTFAQFVKNKYKDKKE